MACLSHRVTALGVGRLADGPMPFAEPGVEATYAPSRSVRITHLALRLELDPAGQRWSGEARIQLSPYPAYAGELAFDLDDVQVEAVTDADGEPIAWSHDDAQLRLRSQTCPSAVVIRWRGTRPARGLYFTGPEAWAPDRSPMAWTQCQDEDAHFVFPCHDHPGTKHPWSIELWGPAGFTLLSNGERGAAGEQGDRAFARFEQREPMPAYLFTAVCARLSVVEAPAVVQEGRSVAVRYLVPEGEEAAVERAMGRTPAMIEAFAQTLGVPYPWPRYDQVVVHDFVFGGMENIGCTTMVDLLLVDERTVREWDPDALVAHELAHQWFGDLVTCQDWSQGWLNESWATYLEFVWWERARSASDATLYRFENFETYLDEAGGRYRRPIVSYQFREPIDVFDRHLYEKGGLVLHALRHHLGDVAFWSGVQSYLRRHGHGTAHTRHFQRALEDASGCNLDGFFHQWLHSPGHPCLTVKLSREPGLVCVTVKQTQTGDGTPPVFTLRLPIEVVLTDGTTQRLELPVRERERTWAIPVSGTAQTVRIDPGFSLPAEVVIEGPEGWLTPLLADACPVVAVRAASALLRADGRRGFDAVVGALQSHPASGVRGRIAALLATRGGDAARDALVAALAADADPVARRAMCEALGAFRDPVAAAALTAVLRGPAETWHLHGAALVALGKTRQPGAVPAISAHLDVAEAWSDLIRMRALSGLAATEEAEVLPLLLERSSRRWPDRLRGAAAAALARLADKVPSVRPAVLERLIEMLSEAGFRSQLQAIDGLAQLKDPKALGALGRVHTTAADGRTRRQAYEAMVRIRAGRTPEEGLTTLRRSLEQVTEDGRKLRDRIEKLERPRGTPATG